MKNYWNNLTTIAKIKHFTYLVLLILLSIFMIQNWQKVDIAFFTLKLNVHIALLIFTSVALGFIAAKVFDFRKIKRQKREISSLEKTIETHHKVD